MFRNIFQKNVQISQLVISHCNKSTKSVSNPSPITCTAPKVAVVLSGCGYLDGSEIHEAVSILSHLTRCGTVPHCFAPDKNQHHVINHCTQEEEIQTRNVMFESSRISRHPVKPLCTLLEKIDCFSAVVFPGGFGVAKNLSDFAIKGDDFSVIPEVEIVIKEFHHCKKPIGVACIAPILIAKVLPGAMITLGKAESDKWPYKGVIDQAKKWGAVVEYKDVHEVTVDSKNLIFSTPAYMYDGEYHEIDDGIGTLIRAMLILGCKLQLQQN